MTNTTNTDRHALERISGMSMSQFANAGDMASECVKVARAALAEAEGQGWELVPAEPTIAMCIAGDGARWNVDDPTRSAPVYRAMLAAAPEAPTAPALTTCNCRWDGDTQVQQCTLHEAHVHAIHEWAERAKAAESKAAAPAVAEPVAWIWHNTKTCARGVYFEDPARFFDLSTSGDYHWKPLYAHPPAPREPLTDEQRVAAFEAAEQRMRKDINLSWRNAIVDELERAHGIGTDRWPLTSCRAGSDGDCVHPQCPQLRDGEPNGSGRHCPLDAGTDREGGR